MKAAIDTWKDTLQHWPPSDPGVGSIPATFRTSHCLGAPFEAASASFGSLRDSPSGVRGLSRKGQYGLNCRTAKTCLGHHTRCAHASSRGRILTLASGGPTPANLCTRRCRLARCAHRIASRLPSPCQPHTLHPGRWMRERISHQAELTSTLTSHRATPRLQPQ